MERRGASEGLKTGAVVLLGLTIPVVVMLVSGTFTPVEMLRPGELGPSAGLVADRIGPQVLIPDEVGYDGQQFWAIAETFPDLDAAAPWLDDPPYRFQRILTPALASIFGGGEPSALALVALTLLGTALSVGCVSDLCARHGRRPELGYLAVVPLAYAIGYSTSEPVAYGLGFLALCLADRDRLGTAALVLVPAVLARESAAVFALAIALGIVVVAIADRRAPSWRVATLAAPLLVLAGWTWWVRSSYEVVSTEQRIVPFGIVDASATGLLLGLATLGLAAAGVWRWRDVAVVWPTVLGFGLLVLTYYGPLFRGPALPRVSAPALTFGLVAVGAALLARFGRDGAPDRRFAAERT